MKKLLNKKYWERVGVKLNEVPIGLYSKTYQCSNCHNTNEVPWLEKTTPSVAWPVEEEGKYKGRWIPTSTNLTCPVCQKGTSFEMPVSEWEDTYSYFGDEAYFEPVHSNNHAVLYSCIGNRNMRINELTGKLHNLKSHLLPGIPAKDWKIHAKVLFNGDERRKDPYLSKIGADQAINFLSDICLLIKQQGNQIIKYVSIGEYRRKANRKIQKKQKKWIRDRTFNLLVLHALPDATDQGVQPNFHFDSDRNDSWATTLFEGNHCTLLYGYLTRGIHVPPIKFVKPASHPILELADVVAFIVRREMHCRSKNIPVEIPASSLGEIYFTRFIGESKAYYRIRSYLPSFDELETDFNQSVASF